MMGSVDDIGLQARLGPARLAAVDLTSEKRWSYADLDADVARCAGALASRDIRRGDRVATVARNRAELVILHHACARIGAIYVPLNWRLSSPELTDLIADSEPAVIWGDDCLESAGISGKPLCELIDEIARAEPLTVSPIDSSQPSLILYTSGTSGRPKGAMLTERNIAATAHNFAQLGQVQRGDAILCDSPMFHVIGIVASVRPFLQQGAVLLISDGFEPSRTLARFGDPGLGITHYFCVPQMASSLRRHPGFAASALRGLKALFTGGAPHPETDIRAWLADGIAVVDGYGMSETGTIFGMPLDPELIAERAGSVGYAAPGVVTRLVDENDRDVGPDAAGELLLKGDNVFGGYWHRPDETAGAFTADGWFRTGDILVSDAAGCHRVIDRRKDMFISGGENIFPGQIEAALADMPGLRECAVIGIPDDKWGEVGHVAVVPEDDVAIDLEAVLIHLEGRIAHYKLPKSFSLHEGLPRTSTGKLQKTVLKQLIMVSDPTSA